MISFAVQKDSLSRQFLYEINDNRNFSVHRLEWEVTILSFSPTIVFSLCCAREKTEGRKARNNLSKMNH